MEAPFLPRKVTVTIPLDCTQVLAVMVNTQVQGREKRRQRGRGEPSGLVAPLTGLAGSQPVLATMKNWQEDGSGE